MARGLTAEVGGQTLRLVFQHEHLTRPEAHARKNGKVGVIKALTRCQIREKITADGVDGEQVVAEGESWCSVVDNFCKETGRQQALRRAITNGGFDRDTGGALLRTYFGRKRQ